MTKPHGWLDRSRPGDDRIWVHGEELPVTDENLEKAGWYCERNSWFIGDVVRAAMEPEAIKAAIQEENSRRQVIAFSSSFFGNGIAQILKGKFA